MQARRQARGLERSLPHVRAREYTQVCLLLQQSSSDNSAYVWIMPIPTIGSGGCSARHSADPHPLSSYDRGSSKWARKAPPTHESHGNLPCLPSERATRANRMETSHSLAQLAGFLLEYMERQRERQGREDGADEQERMRKAPCSASWTHYETAWSACGARTTSR